MLPKMSGWEIAKHLREKSNVPIIMMSALSDEEDILKGYDLKVDDYITKPFNPRVLVAKINALLARFSDEKTVPNHLIQVPHLDVDTKRKVIALDGKELSLARKEFELLSFLIQHPNEICSREFLFDSVWGKDVDGDPRLVDTYVKKLRKHLNDYADFIKTIFGVGYRFEAHD
jgi:DNA-binding response OmpR family regulator